MDPKTQFGRALTMLRSGDYQAVADFCVDSLEQFPGDANFLILSARANLALKEFDTAESHVQEALRLFPDFAEAHETLGDLMLLRGKPAVARSAYETASRLDPSRQHARDKIRRARELEREATRKPEKQQVPFQAELEQATRHEQDGNLQAAEMICREILKKDPRHVEAARILASIAASQKHFRDAEVILKEVVKNAPDYVRAWVELSNVQRERDKLGDAVESATRVLELSPERAESHMVYGGAIGMAGDHEGAIEAYRAALDIAPDRAGALCSMAHHQKTIGQQEAAVASYRRAIDVKADHAEAYWSLANLKTFRFEDEEIAAMEALLEGELPEEARAQLHNALGLEMEGRKDYDAAFSHFAACNAARRPLETYDPVDTESTYDRLIELFDQDFIDSHAGVPEASTTPILIVGLPRSGSTLIEQILASHSQVDGTHELGDLSRAVQTVRKKRSRRSRFPEALADLTVDEWRQIGEEYLRRTEIHRAGAPFFVDKNPNNFIYAGVLRLALPNAKIINARRHPLDSCLGSFKQLFASGQPFTYDVTELAEYYLQYQRLMDFWHERLPGFVLDVQYESVVADLENQVRRILDFCGLPFEEACLRFHETERAVKTASSEQVRRPIYSSSVNLWRRYEPHLDEMVHILKPLLEDLPADDRPVALGGRAVGQR
jgi:tetratricopeptide (TPR) repeat protein